MAAHSKTPGWEISIRRSARYMADEVDDAASRLPEDRFSRILARSASREQRRIPGRERDSGREGTSERHIARARYDIMRTTNRHKQRGAVANRQVFERGAGSGNERLLAPRRGPRDCPAGGIKYKPPTT